jgi:two-component system nitrate/nitrite sensor histidine kinase NarX
MQEKTISPPSAKHSGFSWAREPDFTPPGKDGGVSSCLSSEFAAPRAGELSALLETFLESIIGTVNATAGVVRLLSPDGCTLEIIGSAGLSAELQEEAESFVELDCEANDKTTFGHVIHASDISSCDSRQNCRYASCRFQSLVAAPIEAPNAPGVALGILTVFFDVHREAAKRVTNTIAAFAEVMGAAIEHTRANREVSRMERLAARQEIANDIHDSLAQTLTYARMRVSLQLEAIRNGNEVGAAKYACDLDEALEIAQKSTRELIADFRCELNPGGLLAALRDLAAEFRERNDIVLDYHNRLVDLELPLEHEIQVYHIVREALTNISRHSGATHARLFVDADFGYYVFTIEDNGGGAHTFEPVEGHYGVMIMRERAHRIDGEIRVDSATGLGTRVQLFFPEPSPNWRTMND